MSKENRLWAAFVIGMNEELGKTIASFISFDARNRFSAIQQVEKLLPDSPNWLLSSGQLISFQIVALHQCKPTEVSLLCELYVSKFSEWAGCEPDFEMFSSSPRA